MGDDANFYILRESEKCIQHYILHMPSYLPFNVKKTSTHNIIMIDVSGSMSSYWNQLQSSWNSYIYPILNGSSVSLYTFSNRVFFCGNNAELKECYFKRGRTDLVSALYRINTEIKKCESNIKNIRIFFVTDGDHNIPTKEKPIDVIKNAMRCPLDKQCEVYVLGVGNEYPVQQSIDLRSYLHNGNSNLPSLYSARNKYDLDEEINNISQFLGKGDEERIRIKLSGCSNDGGSILPGIKLQETFHLDEWVYFGTEDLKPPYFLTFMDKEENIFTLELIPQKMNLDMLNDLFSQWNSVLFQGYRKNDPIPFDDIIRLEESLLLTLIEEQKKVKDKGIYDRLTKKLRIKQEIEIKSKIKEMKKLIHEKEIHDEQAYVKSFLKTTVSGSKYSVKAVKLKGHNSDNFHEDCKEFLTLYEEHKEELKNFNPKREDCCRINLASTLTDLKDQNFHMLLELDNKYEFLKNFHITGIPVFVYMIDSLILNPWNFQVKRIIHYPYEILSQIALEMLSDLRGVDDDKQGAVRIIKNDTVTSCNAIIPVFSPDEEKVIRPFVGTRLYAMCATFTMLKNAQIIDYNIHFAALAALWVKLLNDFPTLQYPEYVVNYFERIKTTANLYIHKYEKYWQNLKIRPTEALMTESISDVHLKCESLVKPMFILYMKENEVYDEEGLTNETLEQILKVVLLEFLGRSLKNYKNQNKFPFTRFFIDIKEEQEEEKVIEENIKNKIYLYGKKLYTLNEFRNFVMKSTSLLLMETTSTHNINLNMVEIMNLHNYNLSWSILKTFVRKIVSGRRNIIYEEIIFSDESIFRNIVHALRFVESRKRLSTTLMSYEESLSYVKEQIEKEQKMKIKTQILPKVMINLEKIWIEMFMQYHQYPIKPMKPHGIIDHVKNNYNYIIQNIDKNLSNEEIFDKYYTYRNDVGILRNACQSSTCPFFLHPRKDFNEHLWVDRLGQGKKYPHSLHLTACRDRLEHFEIAIEHFNQGSYTKALKPLNSEVGNKMKNTLINLHNMYKNKNW